MNKLSCLAVSATLVLGCAVDPSASDAEIEVAGDTTAAIGLGTGYAFTKVSNDASQANAVCYYSPAGASDTGTADYTLAISSLTAAKQTKISNAVAAGTARVRTYITDYLDSNNYASPTLSYTATIWKNGVAEHTCSNTVTQPEGGALGVAEHNTKVLCEYAPTSFATTDSYEITYTATTSVTCTGGSTSDQGRASTMLAHGTETLMQVAILWVP